MNVILGNRTHDHRVSCCSSLLQNYQEALRYIGKLPFDQAESNMKCYGKILMHHVPNETTELLKVLCADYRPVGDREGPGLLDARKVQAGLLGGEGASSWGETAARSRTALCFESTTEDYGLKAGEG